MLKIWCCINHATQHFFQIIFKLISFACFSFYAVFHLSNCTSGNRSRACSRIYIFSRVLNYFLALFAFSIFLFFVLSFFNFSIFCLNISNFFIFNVPLWLSYLLFIFFLYFFLI